jgi:hypothetical protein
LNWVELAAKVVQTTVLAKAGTLLGQRGWQAFLGLYAWQ